MREGAVGASPAGAPGHELKAKLGCNLDAGAKARAGFTRLYSKDLVKWRVSSLAFRCLDSFQIVTRLVKVNDRFQLNTFYMATRESGSVIGGIER